MTGKTLETLRRMIGRLFPVDREGGDSTPSDQVPGHLIAPIILLATQDGVLADTFPPNGKPNPQALYDAGVDSTIVKPEMVARLLPYREAFATIQIAWLGLAEYTDPPCLDRARMDKLVKFTRTDLNP